MTMNAELADMVTLGPSGPMLHPLGIGTNRWSSGPESAPELLATYTAAQKAGVSFFDTAEMYGFGGSERALGRCMQADGQKPLVATKFFPAPWRLRKSSLMNALRASLARLGMAQVDLYMIHFPVPPVALETWMDALADAVQAGLARSVGVSNCNAAQMKRAHAALATRGVALACNEVEYSLIKRNVERDGTLGLCRELGVTLIAYRPLASGLLAGKYTPQNPPKGWRRFLYSGATLARVEPLNRLLQEVGAAHGGKTTSQVAINWVICKGALPIPGASNVPHVSQNAGALGWRLSDAEVAALDRASGDPGDGAEPDKPTAALLDIDTEQRQR
jgi:aryl-alcohol dehydrogenase-like predicted oxidoreductase